MPVYRPEELAEKGALVEPESDDLVTPHAHDAAKVSAESGVEGVVGSFRPASQVDGALPTHDLFRVRVQADQYALRGRGCRSTSRPGLRCCRWYRGLWSM